MKYEVKDRLMNIIRKKLPILESIYQIYRGMEVIKNIRKTCGEDTHILFTRGATGDTYIQLLLLHNYVREKKITSYVLLGDPVGMEGLLPMFPEEKYIRISGYRAECIEKTYMLLGAGFLNLTIMFPWTYSLYANRCRIRMLERFNFMDTYKWYVFGLNTSIHYNYPVIKKMDETLRRKFESQGVVDRKTIIIAPEANSVTELSVPFWNEIFQIWRDNGYQVLVNTKQRKKYAADTIFPLYEEMIPLLEYAGYFVGIRSGLCDIISRSKCRKIVIYPQKAKKVNYSEHRSEIDFCGLKLMRLSDEEDDLVELETPLIRNITQPESDIGTTEEYENELKKLKNSILESVY